jgi:hypothetical protein
MTEVQEIKPVENDKPVFTNPPKKPDKLDLDKKVESIQQEINDIDEKIKGIKVQIDKILNDRSGSKVRCSMCYNTIFCIKNFTTGGIRYSEFQS